MPDPLPEGVYWLLWCAAGLAAAWVFLPKLLVVLGQTRCISTLVGGPESARPTGDDPQYADLFETLTDLGFAPLGSRVESSWFLPTRLYRKGPAGRIFATAERDCFASVYRLFVGDRWHVTFCTVFTDDSLASTSNHMANLRIDQEGYLRWGCPSPDLAEVLQRHRRVAEDYRAADARTVDHPDLEGACEAIRYHSERYLRRRGPALVLKGLSNALFFVCVPAAFAALWMSADHWAVPALVLLGGIGYTASIPLYLRIGTRKVREQDRERGLAMEWDKRRQARRGLSDAPPTPSSDAITQPGWPEWDDDRYTRNPPP